MVRKLWLLIETEKGTFRVALLDAKRDLLFEDAEPCYCHGATRHHGAECLYQGLRLLQKGQVGREGQTRKRVVRVCLLVFLLE